MREKGIKRKDGGRKEGAQWTSRGRAVHTREKAADSGSEMYVYVVTRGARF